jgi:type I restriction enzyme S subunit
MSRKFQCKVVPSAWIEHNGRRLDCGPYVSGAIEARELLSQMSTTPLMELTTGHKDGIYNGSPFIRNYVDDENHGVPFLTTSSLLQADLSNLSLLSKRDAHSRRLSFLEIKPAMTLITCSGSIGRMTYARADMEGIWSNQDIMKVVPDPDQIKPGYLYAYLCSRFGVPLVVSGTYGAIIQHIEPQHIADLPVPRLGDVEIEAHRLVQQAADDRVKASRLIADAISNVYESLGMPLPEGSERINRPSVTAQSSNQILKRMDSFYYAQENVFARVVFDDAGRAYGEAHLGDVAEVWIPTIFKRQYVDDPTYGFPYFTGKEMYELLPTTDRYLKRDVAETHRLLLETGMILIQDSGQVSGLIGRPVIVGTHLDSATCTNNMVRVKTTNPTDAGYIFAVLSTTYGIRLLKREASGSSIPHLEEGRIRNLQIPWPDASIRVGIGKNVVHAMELRDSAVDAENQARSLVERTIEEGGR